MPKKKCEKIIFYFELNLFVENRRKEISLQFSMIKKKNWNHNFLLIFLQLYQLMQCLESSRNLNAKNLPYSKMACDLLTNEYIQPPHTPGFLGLRGIFLKIQPLCMIS